MVAGLAAFGMLAAATPASAQYRSSAAEGGLGEGYHIEAAYSWWDAEPSLLVNSEQFGIIGDDVDLVNDLGILKKRLAQFKVTAKPSAKHRFRFERLPIKYSADAVVRRAFVFNGQRYNPGLPVQTSVDFSTYRFGYQYDFLYFKRGFFGAGLDLRYTNVDVDLLSPIGNEFVQATAPIPTFGFGGRGYVTPQLAVDGELYFFRIPDNLSETLDGDGSYTDFDLHATYNFNRYLGGQFGYRRTNVFYELESDGGTLKFSGLYFGGVIRY